MMSVYFERSHLYYFLNFLKLYDLCFFKKSETQFFEKLDFFTKIKNKKIRLVFCGGSGGGGVTTP